MQNFMVMFTFFVFDRKYHFRQIWSEKSKLLVKLKFGTRTIWICRSQSWCSLFLFKTRKTPIGANLVKKYQNCKFKLKFSTKTNLNLWNSTMMFTFSVFDHKHPFWANLVHKFKIVCSKWNLIQRLFEFAKFNVGVYFICFRLEIDPFLGKFGPKNNNCQFKLKIGTYTDSNMKNSVVIFIIFCFWPEVSCLWKFL